MVYRTVNPYTNEVVKEYEDATEMNAKKINHSIMSGFYSSSIFSMNVGFI